MKILNISIPDDKILDINGFSLEENYMMLKIGSECLLEGRKAVVGLTQKDMYNKIKDETREEVQRLELDILVERELKIKMEEQIKNMYESQIEKMKSQMETMSVQIKSYELQNKDLIKAEVDKAKEKFDLILEEKDKQNRLNREVFDKAEKMISKNIVKTSIAIGDDGEQIFESLSDTFKDFAGYRIENKAKQGHKGDFHLFFKDFNILVDSKNYSGSVQKKEVVKIETDLTTNDNMKFAWMVSLNSNISDYNRFPIMTKWITTDVGVKCILFINNLLEHKEPRNILRQAWAICEDLHRLTNNIDNEDIEIEKYRERNLKQKKQIENLQDRAAELRRGINILNNTLKHIDNDLLEMLSLVSDVFVNDKFDLNNKINSWWDSNIEFSNDENKMTSTEIWNKFKKDNKEYVNENKLTIEVFKEKITCIVNSSNYVEKTKKGVIDFIGFKWKQIEVKPIDNLEIENIIIEKIKKVKNKNV
jgi:CII-binding regulator of phage lambda lysogenization HflD